MQKSPMEQWTGKKPSTKHLRVWGCPAFVYIPKSKRTKHMARAWEGVFVGYQEDTEKIWRIWHPQEKKLYKLKFVIFNQLRTGVPAERFNA